MQAFTIIDSSTTKPDISIAMLAYNHENFIVQAIESVLMQKTSYTYKIVIAEDFSTDNTREVILDYQMRYPDKIKLILQNKNVGASKNNEALLTHLEGKYIAALEGDDYWTDPLKLQKQIDVLEENPNLSGCFHNSEERYFNDYSKASKLFSSFPKAFEISIKELTQYNMVPTASLVFRAPIPSELFSVEFSKLAVGDWPLHLLNTRKGNYYYIPQVMSVRNLNPNSTWGMQDHEQNVKKVSSVYTALINSGWFDEEVNSLLKTGQINLENSILPKKISTFSFIKKRVIGKIIYLLNKL